ncbi:MAG: MFS transporter, partial [Actinomycetota bacterium]|nr:MFS transporter [Actinomycetota bacterium]
MTQRTRNRYGFGIGTLGRDAAYTLVSIYLIFYLSDVLEVSTGVLAAVTVVLVVARIFDAVNDPFMGVIVDNTRSRWGKFKPWILIGAV